jgi:hypothetical protein
MYEETIKGKPERVGKIATPPVQETQELMSSANRAIEEYTAKATGARHPLGRGLPADHPALN